MSNDDGKISTRQSLIFIIILFCAPAIRYIPLYTAGRSKQAAWLSPIVTCILEIIYMLVWLSILKKYTGKAFVDIIKDVMGKYIGGFILILYFLWISFLLSYNVRMYAERIVATAMPGVSMFIIISVMLLLVYYVVRNGIITLAKMAELFLGSLALIFVVYNVLVLPQLHVSNLFPITYKDIVPAAAANFGILAIFSYNILIFIFNDKIDGKGDFKKLSFTTVGILTAITFSVIIIPLGVFGWEILIKMPVPYLNAMMEISLFEVIERIEAGIIMFWIIADFTLISIFVYSAMHIIRVSFKVSNVRPLTILYILGIFFLSLALARNTLELKILSERLITWMNITMGYCMPIVIFLIAKMRKKL